VNALAGRVAVRRCQRTKSMRVDLIAYWRMSSLPSTLFSKPSSSTGVFMNIKQLGLPMVLALCAAVAGCSTATVVTLQNGTQYVTKDTPNTKTKDGFYEFEDISGKTVKVRADEVATVKKED
jgi:hypothetical protein